jgi:hypothetical protein
MRELLDHKVNPANDVLRVLVLDEPGAGGANHVYVINGFNGHDNPGRDVAPVPGGESLSILFQNGPIGEVGVNGVTHEALLAVLLDRMRSFQRGPYACRENAIALTKLEEAQMWLLQRTRGRMSRGVEGTHEV